MGIKEQCPYVKISGGISNLSFGFRGVNKIRESIHSVFLTEAITESGMDVGIVNAKEMLHIDDLEKDVRVLCDNLVFNKTPEATEQMMERTVWEKEAAAARKAGTPIPKKPRVVVKIPRRKFAYDELPEKPALEPPAPSSEYAQNKAPASYTWSKLTHPSILKVREGKMPDVSVAGKQSGWGDLRLDWNAEGSASYPRYCHSKSSLRSYITQMFSTEVTMYDGAMGTMIQNQGKWLDEDAYRGERFVDWSCNVKGNNDMLSLTQPATIKKIYKEYLASGSRLIGTNTSSSTTIAQ